MPPHWVPLKVTYARHLCLYLEIEYAAANQNLTVHKTGLN